MQTPRQTAIARKLRKQGSWAQKLMWSWLRDRRFSCYKFRREFPFGPYILNFFCAEAGLNIEVDGFLHEYPHQQNLDDERDAWLSVRGVTVLRFWNSHLRREKQWIRDTIWKALQQRAPHPHPDYCRPGLCTS